MRGSIITIFTGGNGCTYLASYGRRLLSMLSARRVPGRMRRSGNTVLENMTMTDAKQRKATGKPLVISQSTIDEIRKFREYEEEQLREEAASKVVGDSIAFDCAVAKVQTMADGGLRVSFDLPEGMHVEAAWLMVAHAEQIYLRAELTPRDD